MPPRASTLDLPAPVSATATALLMERLGLTEDELCAVLAVDPLTLLTGDKLPHRPELPLLLTLTAEPAERLGEPVLRRWLRTAGRRGVPVDHLLARDFATFEDALADLDDRGFVIGG